MTTPKKKKPYSKSWSLQSEAKFLSNIGSYTKPERQGLYSRRELLERYIQCHEVFPRSERWARASLLHAKELLKQELSAK